MIKLILTVTFRVIGNIVSHIPKLSGWAFLTLGKAIALAVDVDVCSQNCLQSYYEACTAAYSLLFEFEITSWSPAKSDVSITK